MKRTDTPTLSGPLHAGDLINSLLWPRLLRAAGLALNPGRLGMALVMVVLIGIIASVPNLWLAKGQGPAGFVGDAWAQSTAKIVEGTLEIDPGKAFAGVFEFGVTTPAAVMQAYPWSVLIILAPVLLVWGVGGAGIARSAAAEYSLRERTPWPSALGLGVDKALSLLGVSLTPLILAGVVVGLLAVGGWVLLRIPYVQAIGSIAFVLNLLGGALVVLILVGYGLGSPMLIPAIACEGTDAIDAMQRVYAYVLARPVRLVVYLALLLVEIVLVFIVLSVLVQIVLQTTLWASSLLLPSSVAGVVKSGGQASPGVDAGWSLRAMHTTLGFWCRLPGLVLGSFLVSFYFSGGSILYLVMRRVCDGQDETELWRPGMPAGVVQHEPADEAGEDEE